MSKIIYNSTNKTSGDDELQANMLDIIESHFEPSEGSLMPLNATKRIMLLVQADRERRELLNGNHEHQYTAFQCEEGCGCDYIHLQCLDDECSFYAMAEGWDGCNVDYDRIGEKRELEARLDEANEHWKATLRSNQQYSIWSAERISTLKQELKEYE